MAAGAKEIANSGGVAYNQATSGEKGGKNGVMKVTAMAATASNEGSNMKTERHVVILIISVKRGERKQQHEAAK